ncbi:MAG: glycoside hydrolase family 2 protein [Lachnospiraceae bacterium]|nr:glycoside hydrolase family 2 protein [Lachnospiraceae bacterium]
MKRIDVSRKWKMRILDDKDRGYDYIPATVPGSVYNDLLNVGRMEDPYYRDNEMKALELMKHDFEYRGSIEIDKKELDAADEVLLKFDGIDTLADIELNGKRLGSTDNMHRIWEYSVKDVLKDKENELVIVFHSPVEYVAKQYEEDPAIQGTEDAMRGFPKIRKGHYMFGWDWGPRLPDAGLWKDVKFLAVKKARLDRIYIRQKFNDDLTGVELVPDISVKPAGCSDEIRWSDRAGCKTGSDPLMGLRAVVTVIDPEGNKLYDKKDILDTGNDAGSAALKIDGPRLWWPNGLGEQPLYTVVTELVDEEGNVCDAVTRRIGLRKMEMSNVKDEFGAEFAHVVNGVKFFAMGADYIPEDNILSRCTKERTRDLLMQCKAANFNCIRVWGGGLYPSDDFYDACDELGLVVWQDFMFACANYRLTRDFEENILAELRNNIRRLAHHASLGLWCGNNEMEMFVDKGEWGAKNEIKSDYVKMYEYLFPRLLEEEDPDRFYWPASPSCGGGFDEPNSPDRGDVHYWDVWHGNKPFTEYRKFYFRYLSEFGFQSFPSIKTVESFTLPEDRNVFSYVMEKHQRNASANGKIMNYMEQTFLYPNDLDTLIYASQLLQAEAIRYGVEHFRRNRGRCMGTVYWQLNDCWPVASWSSIDYYGRWKALHYYAKRFFAPLMISCEEESLLTQTMNVNAEPFEVKKSIHLSVANETMGEKCGTVMWQLRSNDGSVIREESEEISVGALSSKWLDTVGLPEADLYANYVSYQLISADEVISQGTVLFCPPKHFKFVDPKLAVRLEGDEIVVTSSAYAKSVEIRNDNDDLILSDNFFDLNGDERRIKIIKGEPAGLSVRSVYNIR